IPVTLGATKEQASQLKVGGQAALFARAPEGGKLHAVIEIEELYSPDKAEEAQKVYGTTEQKHPGVAQLYELGEVYVGGKITLVDKRPPAFMAHHNEPKKTRAYFRERGWQRIAAFQTRNPIHRAHEYLTKVALEIADGILIHPLVGYTKEDDIPADVRMRCYEALLES